MTRRPISPLPLTAALGAAVLCAVAGATSALAQIRVLPEVEGGNIRIEGGNVRIEGARVRIAGEIRGVDPGRVEGAVAVAPDAEGDSGEESSAVPESGALLRWRQGDELRGELQDSSGTQVRWASEIFSRPLSVRLDQLERIRFPEVADPAAERGAPPFRVHLVNGDRIEGEVRAISSASLTVASHPFLEAVEIPREMVERVVHLRSGHYRFYGPGDLSTWSTQGRERKLTEWDADPRGGLSTHQWTGNLFQEIDFPEKAEIAFTLEFPVGPPHFHVNLVREANRGPALETWDQILVLTFQNRFVPVMDLTEDTRRLDFRLFWDQAGGELRLCDASGKLLARLADTQLEPGAGRPSRRDPLDRGFAFTNHSPSLRLASLIVREWDGEIPSMIDLSKPRAQVGGRYLGFDPGGVTLAEGAGELVVAGRGYPLAELEEVIFSPPATEAALMPAGDATYASWAGGTFLSGDFQALGNGELLLAPEWAGLPVRLSLSGAREIRFPRGSEPLLEGPDLVSGDGFSLRGTARVLSGDTPEESGIGWLPLGAVEPVPFADGLSATMTRGGHSGAGPGLSNVIAQARLYLDNDEILVGSLLSIEGPTLAFNSPVTGRIEIPVERIRAVDLGETGRVLEGFGDPEWEEIKNRDEDIDFSRDSVTLRDGSFGNPTLLIGDRIRFNARWEQSYGAFTLRLYVGSGDQASASTDLIVAAQGNRLFIGKLKETGAFSFSGDQIPIIGNSADFEFRVSPQQLEVVVNGKSAFTMPVESQQTSGNGIYFKMGGGWQGWNQRDNEITFTNFEMERSPGSLVHRIIDQRSRERALAIPRSRRDPVPRNLLVAPNGDLLRGDLLSASGNLIVFAAGSEVVELPRNRVSAIIWIKDPPPESEGADEEATAETPEGDGSDPVAQEKRGVRELRPVPPVLGIGGPDPFAELEGRADPDMPAADPDMPAAEPDMPAAETAAAPSGDDVGKPVAESDAAPGLPEEVLEKVLEEDPGERHHFVLMDGSRLFLRGERVEPHRFVGHSTILGTCNIILDNVRHLSFGPERDLGTELVVSPAPFPAWELAYTPEPVLPGADDAPDSPLIGEKAPDIDLAMLDDSRFRLKEHLGQVVVLDFWATWCGPCVRAIPEVRQVIDAFPGDAVVLFAVNQAESSPIIRDFLETRRWDDLPVALDFDMKTSRDYQVEGIPHTVVVGRDGRVAWVHTGFTPDLKEDLFQAIVRALRE